MDQKMDFWGKLSDLCKAHDIRPTTVLKSLGISPGNMNRWKEGDGANVTVSTLIKIAEHFNVPVGYFFGEYALSDDIPKLSKKDDIGVFFRKRIADMLGLSKNWNVSNYEISDSYNEIRVHIEYIPHKGCCPKCGKSADRSTDKEQEAVPVEVSEMLGYKVLAIYIRPLVLCPECGVSELPRK